MNNLITCGYYPTSYFNTRTFQVVSYIYVPEKHVPWLHLKHHTSPLLHCNFNSIVFVLQLWSWELIHLLKKVEHSTENYRKTTVRIADLMAIHYANDVLSTRDFTVDGQAR